MTLETHNGDRENSLLEFEGRHIRAGKTIHGTLVQVSGTGVLLLGDAGTGKSDCALELLSRGHKLVADDSVELYDVERVLYGRAPEPLLGLLNIRGLGLIDVDGLFETGSVSASSRIAMCVELSPGDDRLEPTTRRTEFFGIHVPMLVFRGSQMRNLPVLLETAVKIFNKNDGSLNAGHAMMAFSAPRN